MGACVGPDVGRPVGTAVVGTAVEGAPVGLLVGARVVGAGEGARDGEDDGTTVGLDEGDAIGAKVVRGTVVKKEWIKIRYIPRELSAETSLKTFPYLGPLSCSAQKHCPIGEKRPPVEKRRA